VIERVCVIGAGTVGSVLAAHLAGVCEVCVLTRREAHAAALCEHGLRVSGKSELNVRLFATARSRELPPFDLGILACKAPDVEVCATRIAGLGQHAAVMTVQNGLGAESLVADHGRWPIISAVTFMSGKRRSDVHVEYELDAPTWLGPYRQSATPYTMVREVESLISASGLETESMPDLAGAQWSKLIFNSAVNTVAALTGLSHEASFAAETDFADLGRLVRALIEEGVAVATAAGVSLHEDPWQMNLDALAHGRTRGGDYAHTPSMLEDVLAHTPTELEFITGALLHEAHRYGVAAPLNEAMYRLVRAQETSWLHGPAPATARA